MRKILLLLFFSSQYLIAQDTLKLNLRALDSLFLKNNLLLIASNYNIVIQKAITEQSKIWDNPTLNTEWNLYNRDKSQFVDIGRGGQKIIAFEQILKTSSKRKKEVNLNKEIAKMTEFEYYNLMRELKFALRNEFYNLHYNLLSIELYSTQLSLLDSIIVAYQFQYEKGNIPLKEVVRLKALYYELNNEKTDILSSIYLHENNLQTILDVTAPIKPIIMEADIDRYKLNNKTLKELEQLAVENRYDLKIEKSILQQAELNYRLQKSLATPDIRVGTLYDQAGSYINNYSAFTIGMDLPVFNRNQGNIKAANSAISRSKAMVEHKENEVYNDVQNTYNKLVQIEKEYQKIDKNFSSQFELLNKGISENFKKRNLSLIEFIDLFEAYIQSIYHINKIKTNRLLVYEELNFVVGTEIY
jgi:outer membrane protein, heavy metal efflux system